MRVFVTGAAGFIGSAAVQELKDAGHQVVGLARSDVAADALAASGVEAHRGDLSDLESLAAGARGCDGVIHLAFIADFSTMMDNLAREEDAPDAGAFGGIRIPSEQLALAAASRGIRASVVRLPPSVHGDGDHGLVGSLIYTARERAVSVYVADGQNRWPAVHRLDAALLFRLALETGSAGARYHAVAEEGVPFRGIAEIIGQRLNLPVVSKSPEEAAEHFGFLGQLVGTDAPVSSTETRDQLGWRPRQAGVIIDLDRPSYFET